MAMQPYEVLLNQVTEDPSVTPNNRHDLADFLTYETPGSCLFTKWTSPPIIESGKGNKVTDVDGTEYIDCIAGMSSMNIGHGDERVAEVMRDRLLPLADIATPNPFELSWLTGQPIRSLADLRRARTALALAAGAG